MNPIQGKTIIITGASSGIGEATSLRLAAEGANVVLGARRIDKLKAIVKQIEANGGNAAYTKLDVTIPADNEQIAQLAKENYGGIDAIFLNAGIMPTAPLSAMNIAEWHKTVDVNINGIMNGVAAVLPTFIEQKSGHVIAVSSVAGLKAYPGAAVYGGTKWFVRNFMEVLRMESATEGTNIKTSTLYPAAISTELLDDITHEASAQAMGGLYSKYAITPDRIANVVAFALSQPEDTTINEFTIGPATQPW